MEWTRGPTVGRGASATVSVATTTSGQLFAVKSAELSRSRFLQREREFLSKLSSSHIVEYMGSEITCENNKVLYNLFMEYVPGGTLSDEIKKQGGSLDEKTIRLYTHQILQGLNYLHLNGFVHCDVKGQNVLMGENCLKIADLGCARLAAEDGKAAAEQFAGTPAFMAPEVARGEEQGSAADVWALGCTIIEMATGGNPWPAATDPVSALYQIGFSGEVPKFPVSLSDKARDFLSKCLKRESRERWTVEQLLQHPFLENVDVESEESGKNSPISVLDKGIWDSLELPEASRNLTHMDSSSNSPADRIRGLIGSDPLSNLPSWGSDEDWVEVRSNGNEEIMKLSEQDNDMNADDTELIDRASPWDLVFDLEDFENSIAGEDQLAELSVMPCQSVINEIVSKILTSDGKLMKALFLFNSIVHLFLISTLFFRFPVPHSPLLGFNFGSLSLLSSFFFLFSQIFHSKNIN
ncbi:Mitogen-activated protein kinase kinase kinase [Bertholletia excelsa]